MAINTLDAYLVCLNPPIPRRPRCSRRVRSQVDLVDLAPVVPPWKNRAGAPLNGAEGGGMKRLSVELLPHAGAS